MTDQPQPPGEGKSKAFLETEMKSLLDKHGVYTPHRKNIYKAMQEWASNIANQEVRKAMEGKFTFDQVMETLKQYVPKREYEVVYDAHIHFAKENNRLEKENTELSALKSNTGQGGMKYGDIDDFCEGFAIWLGENGVSVTAANNLKLYLIHKPESGEAGQQEVRYTENYLKGFLYFMEKLTNIDWTRYLKEYDQQRLK